MCKQVGERVEAVKHVASDDFLLQTLGSSKIVVRRAHKLFPRRQFRFATMFNLARAARTVRTSQRVRVDDIYV